MKLNLVRYPDPKLLVPSTDVTAEEWETLKTHVDGMKEVMHTIRGFGLAAVQVGINKRFCLMASDAQGPTKDKEFATHVMINPRIVETDGTQNNYEGCLSLPLFMERIERPEEVTVEFLDENFKPVKAVFSGVQAQCVCHEIDHMDGKLQIDKVSIMKQQMYRKKLKKRGAL